jgi:hypothetical protein
VGVARAPERPGASERVYAGLLRLYPAPFRRRYAGEMVVLFADLLRDARSAGGIGGVAAIWLRGLGDLVTNAAAEHFRRDRTVAQSLATFEPTRSMRLLGLFGAIGAALLLLGFVSWDVFADPAVNRVRLVVFALAGAAIALGFHGRQAAAAPMLAILTTALVVIGGLWYVAWTLLAPSVESPNSGGFGLIGLFAGIGLWTTPTLWAIGQLRTGAAWRGMSARRALATRVGLAVLIGSIAGWLGDDRLTMVVSLPVDASLIRFLAVTGVLLNGLGWLVLGGVLLGGRSRQAPA